MTLIITAAFMGWLPSPVTRALAQHHEYTIQRARIDYLNCQALQDLAKRDPTRCFDPSYWGGPQPLYAPAHTR
jgi:hypothetical protein